VQVVSAQRQLLSAIKTAAAPERWALRTCHTRNSSIDGESRTCTSRTANLLPLFRTYLLDKRTVATIQHENVGSRPGSVVWAARIALSGVNILIAQGAVGVVDILGNRSTVGRNTKESLTVLVPVFRVQPGGDL
jgi:hypothetical protein